MVETSRTVANGIMEAVSMQPAPSPVGGLLARALLLPCWPGCMMRRWRSGCSCRSGEGFAGCSCEPGRRSRRDRIFRTEKQLVRAENGLAAVASGAGERTPCKTLEAPTEETQAFQIRVEIRICKPG